MLARPNAEAKILTSRPVCPRENQVFLKVTGKPMFSKVRVMVRNHGYGYVYVHCKSDNVSKSCHVDDFTTVDF